MRSGVWSQPPICNLMPDPAKPSSGGSRNQEGEAGWNKGIVEGKNGMLEYWNNGILGLGAPRPPIIPLFQYSIVSPSPTFHHSIFLPGVRPMNRLRRTSQVRPFLGCWTDGGYVRSVYAPEPPWCACSRVRRRSVRGPARSVRSGVGSQPLICNLMPDPAKPSGYKITKERLRIPRPAGPEIAGPDEEDLRSEN